MRMRVLQGSAWMGMSARQGCDVQAAVPPHKNEIQGLDNRLVVLWIS